MGLYILFYESLSKYYVVQMDGDERDKCLKVINLL